MFALSDMTGSGLEAAEADVLADIVDVRHAHVLPVENLVEVLEEISFLFVASLRPITHVLLLARTHQLRLELLELLHFLLPHRLSLRRVLANGFPRLDVHVNRFFDGADPASARLHVLRAQNDYFGQTRQLKLAGEYFDDLALL